MARLATLSACVAASIVLFSAAAIAQEATPPANEAQEGTPSELPPVEVTATTAKAKTKTKKTATTKPTQASAQQAPTTPQPSEAGSAAQTETATGPVKGIVATRSATGTKTDTPLIETPQSISVITADRVKQQGAVSISDALGYTAGVTPSVYGVDTRFDWLRVRGFNSYLPGFFVDGTLARNNNTWSVWKVEPYGQERIEVLKGPPSVLYGQANVGGMVNVVSKRPLDEPLNEVELRFGSHNRIETAFDFSGPATQDGKVLYRLTGVVLDTDTQVDFTEQERVYIAPAVTWRPSAGTSLTLLSQYLKEDDVPNIGFLPALGTLKKPDGLGYIPRSFFTGEPGYDKFEQEQWAIGYAFEHRFDEVWQVRQNLRYRETDVDYKTVYGTGLSGNDPHKLTRGVFTSFETVNAFTVDNQVQADFVAGGIKHTVLAGLDYQRNKFDQRSGSGSLPSTIDPYDPVYGAVITDPALYNNSDTTLTQTGLYLQEQAKIDRWIVTLGGRYDWAESEIDNRLNGTTSEQKDEAFTWKGAILYHAANGLAPYYSYSESFFPVPGSDGTTGAPFKPETGQQHEVGIKYEMPGIRSLFTLAAFDITRQNYVTYENVAPFPAHQTGEIRSRGVEFEATAELARGLDLIAAYTWLPTFEITKSSNPGEIGKREPTVAEHMASLWLHYRLQDGLLAGFGFGGGVRYIGETFGNLANSADMKVPEFTLFDGVVDYEKDGWRLAVNVKNIADERTFTCDGTCYYGEGRTVLGTIGYRW